MAEAPRPPADPAAGGRIPGRLPGRIPGRLPGRLVVELVRGLAGTTRYQREVVRGLGLRRLGAVADRPDTPMIRGMVARVPHLVRIVSAGAPAPAPDSTGSEGTNRGESNRGEPTR